MPPTAYVYTGRLLLQSSQVSQTGDTELYLQEGGLRLVILAPLLGTRLLEIRANEQQVLILDYQKQRFEQKPNTAELREEWLGVDLSPQELRLLLTTPNALLQESERWQLPQSATTEMVLQRQDATGAVRLTIQVRSWQEDANGRYPYRLEVQDEQSGNRLVLVVRERAPLPTIRLDFTPPEAFPPASS